MNHPSADPPVEPSAPSPILGPAVSSRTQGGASSLGTHAEPLAPFVPHAEPLDPAEAEPTAEAPPVEVNGEAEPAAAESAPGPDEAELPWLVPTPEAEGDLGDAELAALEGWDPEGEFPLPAPGPSDLALDEDPIVPIGEIQSEPSADATPEPAGSSGFWDFDTAFGADEPVTEAAAPTEDRAEAETPLADEPWLAPTGAGAPAPEPQAEQGSLSPVMAEMADRLERIARSLRERAPGDLLGIGEAADPLELLVAGYALGYAEAQRRGAGRSGQ